RLLQTHYTQAARELKLSLVDATIDPQPLSSGQAFEFRVSGETYPEVKLADWKAAELTSTSPEITDEVLERTLSDLQERNATFDSVDRPIEASDQVTIEEQGEDGGTYPVYLDVAEPHVREALLGKAKDDTVEITVPAHQHGDHEHPEHTVTVKVMDIKTKQLQELGDDFAKSLNFDSMDRLRTDLKGELQRRATQEGDSARREEFITHLVDGMQVTIPQALLDRRREAMLEEIQDDLGRQGVKWAEYESFMKEQNKLDDFMADLSKNAESRVKRDLALEQLAEDLKVQVSDSEFNQTMTMLAQSNNLTPQALQKQLGPNGINSYYTSLVREKGLQQALSQLGKGSEDAAPVQAKEAPSEEAQSEEVQAGAAPADDAAAEESKTEE
ncbi:trigger factor, partial [Deinococcus sp.]|uniref:trigger factor n=1 Tax=Deinococcus sp. TaxID=47478 RepID=UPI002869CBBD